MATNQDTNTTAVQETTAGPRGEIGESSAGQTIKRLWHEATHVLQNVGNRHNTRKQEWVRKSGTPSLKQFARKLLNDKDEVAVRWFENKRGVHNEKRTDANRMRATLERSATKASRHKGSK